MHELSLCSEIMRIVEANSAGRPVHVVELRIGMARQVVPATLNYCWEVITERGPLAGAVLEIEHVPVRLRCRGCDAVSEIRTPSFRCGACGGTDLEMISGDELSVVAIDVESDPAPA